MVDVNPEDFALRLWFEQGRMRARLILDGENVFNLLKEIKFNDPHKEFKRKLYLERKKKDF